MRAAEGKCGMLCLYLMLVFWVCHCGAGAPHISYQRVKQICANSSNFGWGSTWVVMFEGMCCWWQDYKASCMNVYYTIWHKNENYVNTFLWRIVCICCGICFRSYYFSSEVVGNIFVKAGFEIISNMYINRRTINKKEDLDVPRIFVQGKFRKPTCIWRNMVVK
jgi:hypothetical protein